MTTPTPTPSFSCTLPVCVCARDGIHPRQCLDDQKAAAAKTPSAEAMACAKELYPDGQDDPLDVMRTQAAYAEAIDRHLAPLRTDLEAARKENERMTTNLQTTVDASASAMSQVIEQRDALRARVAELENDKIIIGDKLCIERSYNEGKNQRITALESELAESRADTQKVLKIVHDQTAEIESLRNREIALETANKALEADKARLDWLRHQGVRSRQNVMCMTSPVEEDDGGPNNLRAAIDAAIADAALTQSGGQTP